MADQGEGEAYAHEFTDACEAAAACLPWYTKNMHHDPGLWAKNPVFSESRGECPDVGTPNSLSLVIVIVIARD